MTASTTRPRVHRRARHGFTLIEMMVALTIGAMVIASVYTIGSSAARHFQEQQRVSQLQLSVRLALDRIRRDAARAAYGGTMNSATDPPCGAPAPRVRGVLVTDRAPVSTAALNGMTGWTAGSSHGDQLDISGNFRTNEALAVREWSTTNLLIETNWMSYRRTFSANPATNDIDTAAVGRVFAAGTPLLVRFGNGARIWTTATGVTADPLGDRARITTNTVAPTSSTCPGAVTVEGWAQGGVTFAPVTLVSYSIQPAPPGLAPRQPLAVGANTVLMRTEFNPINNAVIEGPTPVLEYAIHFDVDVFQDIAAGAQPSRIQVVDDAIAGAVTLNSPARVRGLRISLAARTPESDPRLSEGVAPLGDGTPRVFRVFADRAGGARVRSAYTEVFLPNSPLN